MHAGGQHVIVSGASGLIGTALTASLLADGYRVTHLVRKESRSVTAVTSSRIHRIVWDPDIIVHPEILDGADAVVCLNGAPISRLPWTNAYRHELTDSRIIPARTLALSLGSIPDHPPLFVCASATGFYGSAPGEVLDERSGAGDTFLAALCLAWERTAHDGGPGVPVAILRTASLLHPQALLKPLIAITRLGIAGNLGSGRQIWPWITLTDEVRAIRHIIAHRLTGPFNLVSPTPASAGEIVRILATRLRRPYWLPVPKPLIGMVIGSDAAQSLITADAHVVPNRLRQSGFTFVSPELKQAMDDITL